MANRNFDSHVIIQRLQNRIYSRNLYQNNTSGQRLINNPQTTDGNSSRYVPYHAGAQTEYFRTLEGTTMVSEGGTANIPPYPAPTITTTVPSAPTSLIATPGNTQVSVAFIQSSTGGRPITNYQYSIDNGATFIPCSPPVLLSPVLITGLTNGTTYQIMLKAVNVVGTSAASAAVSATPATVPDAPVIISASNGNSRATINFTQGSNGGSPILNYYYSTDNGATFHEFSPEVTASPVIITGLTNGTTYLIRLRAINLIGLSDVSDNISVTPLGPPDAPTSLVATPGNAQVSVAFTQGSDGGSPITNYYYSTDNGATFYTLSPADTVSPVVITGLTNGITYQIKLQAVNIAGASVASAAVTATPSATVPNPPVITAVTAGNTQASVYFARGVYDGGSIVTNYLYSIDNGITFTAFSPADTLSPVVITGLTNGTTYIIKLKSINAIGESNASNASSIIPGVPDAPFITAITPGDAQLSVAFSQGSNGGSPITNYQYSTDNGVTYSAFSPADTASPVLITTLSTDGSTPLVNGTAYTIILKAVNVNGQSPTSNPVTATPVGHTILTYSIVRSYTWTAPAGITSIDYLVVGGGGGSGGGYDTGGGGGGGGGMVLSGTYSVTPGNSYNIVVGDGGMGGTSVRTSLPEINGSPGNDSSFDTIVALGGSGGYASRAGVPSPNNGGGSAAINPTTASNGGNGGGSIGDGNGSGGGGGGSLGNGANGAPSLGGAGGSGTVNSISGSALTYGKGGQGAKGGINNNSAAGATNTGNGADAAGATSSSYRNGAKGGSGVVIISYTA